MDRYIEFFGTKKVGKSVLAIAILCLGFAPAAFAQTCMTESLLMIDEPVEVNRPHPVKKIRASKKHQAGSLAKSNVAATSKASVQSASQPMDVSGTKISHAHAESAR